MLDKILNFIKSKAFITLVVVLFGLALLAGTFGLGLAVGYHKARFSYAWGENYHRNFGGPKGGFFGGDFLDGFSGRDLIDAHGVFGQIAKIDGSTLIIKGRDNVEKIVLVQDDTSIMSFRDAIKLADLKIDDNVMVIGEPDDQGRITAKFIRLMPIAPMPSMRMR